MVEPPLLRPLRFVDFINEAFDLSRRCFWLIIAVGAVVYVPAAILVPYTVAVGLFSRAPLLATAAALIVALMLTAANGAIIQVLLDRSLGRQGSATAAWSAVLRCLPAYVFTSLLAWGVAIIRWIWWVVAILVLMARFLTPEAIGGVVGVLLFGLIPTVSAIWFSFLWCVLLTEKVRYRAAVRRGSLLLAGHWCRLVGFAFLALLSYVPVWVIVAFALTVGLGVVRAIAPGVGIVTTQNWFEETPGVLTLFYLAGLVVTPLVLVLSALLYIDVRVRKEALDLEWIAGAMGGGAEGDAPRESP